MKHRNSFKMGLIAVAGLMSLTSMVQADGVDVRNAYQKISGILHAVKDEASSPNTNMSNTYSGKLLNNVEAMQKDAKTAAAIAPRGQTASGGLSVLIRISAAAADSDAIHGFSADARQKIAAELDGAIDHLIDQHEVDDANHVLNVLEAGGATEAKMVNTPARRKRNLQYKRHLGAYTGGQYKAVAPGPDSATSRLESVQKLRNTGFF